MSDTPTHRATDPAQVTGDAIARDARAAAELLVSLRTLTSQLDTALVSLATRVDTWPTGFMYARPLFEASDLLECTLGRLPEIERALAHLRDASRS